MLANKILIHPSVSDFLEELPNILITEGYLQPKAIFPVTEKICNTLFSKEASHPVQHGISFSLNKTNVFWLSI